MSRRSTRGGDRGSDGGRGSPENESSAQLRRPGRRGGLPYGAPLLPAPARVVRSNGPRGRLMARKPTGTVVEPKAGRAWALRFRAYGKRRYLTLPNCTSAEEAEAALRHVLADVERGIWQPYTPPEVEAPAEVPTFHRFASEWLRGREGELRPRTVADYEWCLSNHLLPFFERDRLDQIDVAAVDRYKAQKVRKQLGAAQINRR